MGTIALNSKIYIAGHRGLVGSAVVRAFQAQGYQNLIFKTSAELNLTDQKATESFFKTERPNAIVLAAARVGGIIANRSFPTEFLYQNLMIASNVIHAAAEHGAEKLLFLGSSCIYPKFATQPIQEESLLTGKLEETNEAYAIAKIAGLKLAEYYRTQHGKNFFSAMPSNLYGPGDNFHPEHSHVIPGLIRRFHQAKLDQSPVVKVWGSGKPLREFLHVDDLAKACLFLLNTENQNSLINVGTGEEVTIEVLSHLIAKTTGYTGKIEFDLSKPDGTPRKVMDSSKIHAMGWKSEVSLEQGLKETYQWYVRHLAG